MYDLIGGGLTAQLDRSFGNKRGRDWNHGHEMVKEGDTEEPRNRDTETMI